MVGGEKTAVGVKGVWTSRNLHGGVDGPITNKTVREVIVKAKKVIVSCGTLWSPVILLNSGLTVCQTLKDLEALLIHRAKFSLPQLCRKVLTIWPIKNRHIGRNLYLHPVNVVAAVFKEDVKPWEGKTPILRSLMRTPLTPPRRHSDDGLHDF